MAIITNQLLAAHRKQFSKLYQGALTNAEISWDKIATKVSSSTSENTYGWLGQWPQFREWVGDRVHKSMKEHGYSLTNKKYESSVAVQVTDIEDDNIGIYAPMFAEMGRAAAVFPDELVYGLLKQGETELCYDGQPFFDADHPVYENVDGTGEVVTVSNHSGGTGTPWYLFSSGWGLKALIYQERKAPEFTYMTNGDDESVYMRDEYRYGIKTRCNVGFGFWQAAHISKQELNADALNSAITAMQSLKTDGGRPLGVMPDLLVVPPSLRSAALEVIKAERKANGATNVNRDAVEILVAPLLA